MVFMSESCWGSRSAPAAVLEYDRGSRSVTTSTSHREDCIDIMFDVDRSILNLHRAD